MRGGAYRSAELCEAAGITYRQLDWWFGTGVMRPSVHVARGSGHCHLWSEQDVALAKLMGRLAPVLLADGGEHPEGPALFRFVAQEAAEMDLSRGWLVVAPNVVRWCGTAEDVATAVRGLAACTVVVLEPMGAAKGAAA